MLAARAARRKARRQDSGRPERVKLEMLRSNMVYALRI